MVQGSCRSSGNTPFASLHFVVRQGDISLLRLVEEGGMSS